MTPRIPTNGAAGGGADRGVVVIQARTREDRNHPETNAGVMLHHVAYFTDIMIPIYGTGNECSRVVGYKNSGWCELFSASGHMMGMCLRRDIEAAITMFGTVQ